MYVCDVCEKSFSRGTALANHMKSDTNPRPTCETCNLEFKAPSKLTQHLATSSHKLKSEGQGLHSHFQNVIREISLKHLKSRQSDISQFVRENSNQIRTILNGQAPVKFKVIVKVLFRHNSDDDHITLPISTPYITKLDPISKTYMSQVKRDLTKEFEVLGEKFIASNWAFQEFRKIVVEVCKINVLSGSSFIDMPFKSVAM